MRALLLALSTVLAAPVAQAQLWGYVDGSGMAHFASAPLNAQYQPVLSAGADPQAVPGKTDSSRQLLTWLEIAPEVKSMQPYLREAARQSGVDTELLKAIIAVESGYKADAVSPRGATGLMQLSVETAQRYATRDEARRPPEALLRDPRTNVRIGARMLADLIRRFGRIDAALAAWNAGEGAVRRAGGRMPDIEETQAHVHMVLELYWALLQQSLPGQAQRMKIHAAAR